MVKITPNLKNIYIKVKTSPEVLLTIDNSCVTSTEMFSFSRSMSIKYLVPLCPMLLLDMWSSETVSHS